jgi:hypothetical protein
MGEVTLIDCKETLSSDRLRQAVKHALVKVTRLVVHTRHDRI